MNLATAQRASEEARNAAAAEGIPVAIVIVDAAGDVTLCERMDGAYMTATSIATKKAFTAANFGKSTKEMADRLATPAYQLLVAQADPRLAFLQGGLPLLVDGELLGAVGVSGGSAEQDERYAQVAVSAATAHHARR